MPCGFATVGMETMNEDLEISMSQHLFEQVSCFVGTGDADSKIKKAESLKPFIQELDGFLSFGEPGNEGQLPVLEWNAHFRKAYTLLLWIRPVLGEEKETTIYEDNSPPPRRILYRFSTSHNDAAGLGVCVTVGDWRVIKKENDPPNCNRRITTTLTAFSLPNIPATPMASMMMTDNAPPFVKAPIELYENQWTLLGITHVYPYLKRPHWTVCVDGRIAASGELLYPVLDKSPLMQFNTLFKNVVENGATVHDEVSDAKKTASELQCQVHQRLKLSLHLASFCLSNEALSSTIQALLAQAGPALSLQQNGAIPLLPPIANWTKGSSLEGPNVGIPLVVHGQALQLQQLASSCVVWGSAIEARLLGSNDALRATVQRIICRMPDRHGTTHGVPRVGLVQPTPPSAYQSRSVESGSDSDAPISLTIIGSCSVHHNLSDYLLHSPDVTNVDTQLFQCTKHFSLLMESQLIDSQLLLPFFLALTPPGIMWDLQKELYEDSLKHLHALYSNDGLLASTLLNLFTAALRSGGGRWHEQVLQNGSIHILTSSLRQSLVRAEALNIYKFESFEQFSKAHSNDPKSIADKIILPISPTKIPGSVARACVDLIDACCGPACLLLEDLSPANQINRTSDLALTTLFGIALDLELWGRNLDACALILEAVAERYGGPSITAGYILRSQISVQFVLDLIKSKLDRESPSANLERAADACASLLEAMLLSSLSNLRSVSQGEHDVSACMGALSDCPLGTVGAHVIFGAVMRVLQWCDIFPLENNHNSADEDHKTQVASRLARNLLMGQFHDVVAPMLLSRTVFCAERTMASADSDIKKQQSYDGALSWRHHWRLALLTFAWVSSIAGPEGVIAAKSLGSLLLASGLAGSLKGALDGVDKAIASTLFLPPPTLALSMAASQRNEWSYTDVLSDRLQIMMPLLPGLVVSLLSHPSDVTVDSRISTETLNLLSELLTAVGGAFYRVFGGLTHSAVPRRNNRSSPRKVDTGATGAAKNYVPHLLVVAMVLENHIELRKKEQAGDVVKILQAPQFKQQKGPEDGSWVEVSSTVNESLMSDVAINLHDHSTDFVTAEAIFSRLIACQKSIIRTICELLTNAMRAGGGETATALWRSVLSTLKESVAYAARASKEEPKESSLQPFSKERKSKAESMAHNVLCRLAALVLIESLKRDHQWEVWDPFLGSGISRLCLLVEEKELLLKPLGKETESGSEPYTADQILLLCALVEILKYGRDATGWCQLILPSPPTVSPRSNSDDDSDASKVFSTALMRNSHSAPGASKLMLPVLQPCLRVLLDCASNLSSNMKILVPRHRLESADGDADLLKSDAFEEDFLVRHILCEVGETITAAIVGLSFPNSRDVALHAMASLRRAIAYYRRIGEDHSTKMCSSLLCSVAEEIRVRYEGERRRRENALFDAYEEDTVQINDRATRLKAAADALEIENLILGGDIVPMHSEPVQPIPKRGEIEEVSFTATETLSPNQKGKADGSEDFVLFHDAQSDGSRGAAEENRARMQWSRYEGLGKALEECSKFASVPTNAEKADVPDSIVDDVLGILTPYLDSWDESAAVEAAESELVELFDFSIEPSLSDGDGLDNDLGYKTNLQQLPILGSETAADSMSTFIEFAAVEKSRLAEFSTSFLPNHRNSIVAYAERFCWARYIEVAKEGGKGMNKLWERGIADGNRDIRSRLVTIPSNPQFKRYIPKYLDHSADRFENASSEGTNASENEIDSLNQIRMSENSSTDIDRFTKTLLETGHLEIVDITKKEVIAEEEPDIVLPSRDSLDEEGIFGDEPLEFSSERNEQIHEPKKAETTETESVSTSDVTSTTEATSHEETAERESFDKMKLASSHYNITTSAFASPPDNSSSTLSLIHSAGASSIELHVENCLHVKAEGSRKCTVLLTATHLILEYDVECEGLYEGEMMAVHEEAERQKMIEDAGGKSGAKDGERIKDELERRQKEAASLRPKSIRWNLSELSHVYLRRYRLRDSSLEMFFIPSGGASFGGYGLYSPSTSLFLDFGPGYEGNTKRDDAAFAIMKRAPPQTIKQWPDRSSQFLHEQLSRLTIGWVEGRITNFDYLLHLNMLAGRSYNDVCQYPVMPWVLADYRSEVIPDLCNKESFRDLSKPMGALNPSRLEDFIERFNTFADPSIPPFMYGSHYSTSAGVVLHFLVRLHPYAGLHRQLQGGHFDVADRLFSSVPRTWEMCTGSSAAEVKELTPEWYCNPAFLKNTNSFKLGTTQDGEVLGDVTLPPWAKGKPETFIEVMRNALESDICSEMLPDWIDLIFGRKQQGPEAIAAHNVFFYLTYYGSVDVASIEDESLRQATELQIAHFGQCPMQLFTRPHVRRVKLYNYRRLSFYQILSAYTQGAERPKDGKEKTEIMNRVFGEPLYLPFFSAPLSHWVHLDAPPPGPHAPLVNVRLAGTDRCLAVDARGVFHCFRWAWKADQEIPIDNALSSTFPADSGCFIAQRELPRFRTVPRLVHTPRPEEIPAVAISKTLFASRTVLLVLSDGDGRGAVAFQLVDPAKGSVRGEVVVNAAHSGQVTCIATDPIGTAAGQGGVGGELAIIGSSDGTASIWRFMSSHFLPLRPRVRMAGHGGKKISAVCLSAAIHIAATVSAQRICLHSVGNGNLIRIIDPPTDTLDLPENHGMEIITTFADTPALAISVQGFVVAVCETIVRSADGLVNERKVITLHLFSLEGVSLGSKPLESWRGVPHKMSCTPDGTAVLVCSGRGVTIHRLSAITPLEFIDEWHITETDELTSSVSHAWDIDLGPALNRPVVAAAACTNGVLRLHALAGISAYSERHKSMGITQTVGSALSKPAKRLRDAVGKGFGLGSKVVGVGKEIGKEVQSDVKERGVGGFLGSMFSRKSSN